jgi:hypothetical protein
MAALFSHGDTVKLRAGLLAAGVLLGGGATAYAVVYRSPLYTRVGMFATQPIPFSHRRHVGGLGLDCRYCHTLVEESASAGMPASETCMRCHSQIWSDAALLAPLRESVRRGTPLRWTRVYDLPGYVYFDHSAHVAGGIGCVSCHGRVDRMPLTRKHASLSMRWCLSCHRDPEPQRRARDAVFSLEERVDPSSRPAPLSDARREHMIQCDACHR